MAFLERCPNCDALVHIGRKNRCPNCKMELISDEQNSPRLDTNSSISKEAGQKKYSFLQIIVDLIKIIAVSMILAGIVGIIYGIFTYSPYFNGIDTISIVVLSVTVGILGGIVLYIIMMIIQIIIDIEFNTRQTNMFLSRIIDAWNE
ncbi:MAG: hypothetical protein JXB49_14470 [Bacteroidales bacterium]|nr:hypothetical protein [Bacteroidales bacterium]